MKQYGWKETLAMTLSSVQDTQKLKLASIDLISYLLHTNKLPTVPRKANKLSHRSNHPALIWYTKLETGENGHTRTAAAICTMVNK